MRKRIAELSVISVIEKFIIGIERLFRDEIRVGGRFFIYHVLIILDFGFPQIPLIFADFKYLFLREFARSAGDLFYIEEVYSKFFLKRQGQVQKNKRKMR
jgi:hypothetical protein